MGAPKMELLVAVMVGAASGVVPAGAAAVAVSTMMAEQEAIGAGGPLQWIPW